MKAINVPFMYAESLLEIPPDWVLISITSDFEHEPRLQVAGDHVLKVRFMDITGQIEYKGQTVQPMGGDTALQIIDFIEKNLDKNFIVHCHAGVSRSSAVCLFMHIIYGYELKENFWKLSAPNTHVIGELIKVKYYRDYCKTV